MIFHIYFHLSICIYRERERERENPWLQQLLQRKDYAFAAVAAASVPDAFRVYTNDE